MTSKHIALKLMGKKRGMTQLFDDKGNVVVCTVIEAEPNVITQIKTAEADGYYAIQSGFEKIIVNNPKTMGKRCSKPLIGHFEKSGASPRRYVTETRVDSGDNYA